MFDKVIKCRNMQNEFLYPFIYNFLYLNCFYLKIFLKILKLIKIIVFNIYSKINIDNIL